MQKIDDIDTLERLYGAPVEASVTKVMTTLTPTYRRWIDASPFCVLSTVGPEGTDATPRGDDGPVVRIADSRTILMPDWRGNNRLDSLRNIVRDGRVSLMFFVPHSNNVVRVNGRAFVTVDADVTTTFEQAGRHPKSVIVLHVEEVYFQCAKALLRSRLWSREACADVPSAGAFLRDVDETFDAERYDMTYVTEAQKKMW
jgi:PPOX class probable FMN-dependent enzyme